MFTADIFEIKRFAVHDGDGIRTTIFFKGCPLKCKWCHNPEGLITNSQLAFIKHKCVNCGECTKVCETSAHILKNGEHFFERNSCITCGKCVDVCPQNALKIYGKKMTVDNVIKIVLEDKLFYETSGGGVTLSGGECLLQSDFCAELLRQLKGLNINTAVDTCGYISHNRLDKVVPFTDVFLYDIKAFDSDLHLKLTGVKNDLILDNLIYLDSIGKKIEIRIPFVPTCNDNEIEDIAKFLSKLKNIVKIKILPYHNFASSKYSSLDMLDTLPNKIPTNNDIENAKNIIKKYCLNVE